MPPETKRVAATRIMTIYQVPKAMQEKYSAIVAQTDQFAAKYLNAEYQQLVNRAIAALCRKKPSPLVSGSESSWAAAVIHAIGTANFLFDRSQTPHCSANTIYDFFGISPGTGQAKSKKIRELLKIRHFSVEWTLPSKVGDNPMIWMLHVNGMLVDVRHMPREVQEIAFQKGLIPFIPADRN
jgi:hypothetical protein